MEFKGFDLMVENVLNSFFNKNTFEEDFFSKKIIAGRYEIYPYYNLKISYLKSDVVAIASINPLAIVIKEIKDKNEDEYYIHLFNDSKEDDETYITKILEKFVNFVS
jgi:hypothetical protein